MERQVRRAGLPIPSPRRLVRHLAAIRDVVVLEPGPRGRPRVRRQLEDFDPPAERLVACLGLLPSTGANPVVTTGPSA